MAIDYDLHCVMGGTVGGIDLGNGIQYDLHADTRSQRQVSWRKQTVENPWVEGSYDVQAVRGNITELVAVWVYGSDPSEFRRNVEYVAAVLASPSWPLVWTINGLTETWDCTFSDYNLETQREFQYANTGIMRMSIQRRPRVTLTYSDGSSVSV